MLKLGIKSIKFVEGLIPAIIQDCATHEILMLAYMNRESLTKTLKTKESHFYSRSRQKLWRKGETSGHTQKVHAVSLDCDGDTLLVKVDQTGVACHTGARSCFFTPILKPRGKAAPHVPHAPTEAPSVLEALYQTLSSRKRSPSKASYSSTLFQGGMDMILKKVGEEAGEFIISAKNKNKTAIRHEAADLFYHLLVALCQHGISFQSIEEELVRRSGQSGLTEKKNRGQKEAK